MNSEMVGKAEVFLKETFGSSAYFRAHPTQRDYRLGHSYRVANLAKFIAQREGMDVTWAVLAGLLHDIAYGEGIETQGDWVNHGRRSAAIARPFLEDLGLPSHAVNEICCGIAIHVDDRADFAWTRTPFCETVGDADNIDRYDAYRIYETLQYLKYSEMSHSDKGEVVATTLEKLNRFKEMKLATATATALWTRRLEEQISFYERLRAQLEHSTAIL